ncbi:glycosyltransferase family 2 protein [Proteiniclasticum sp. C24MP]|uniref:glycosyltransferase family 2 protein n=1 Tax=Proteiniclasticum sp. C24MP TaxID=3374101 RepID=UPI0037540112
MNNLVSVTMNVYNEEKRWIMEAIDSILLQTYENLEFIIVYDNPADEELLVFLENYTEKDGRVRIIVNEKNIGISASQNRSLAEAKGDFIVKMDADDVSLPDRIERQMAFLKKHQLDMVAGERTIINEDSEVTADVTRNLPEIPEKAAKLIQHVNFIIHPSVLYRRKLVESAGGYRDFPMSVDYDLWLRAVKKGFKIGVMNEKLIQYRVREKSVSHKDLFKLYLIVRYQQNLFRKDTQKEHTREALEKFLMKNGYYDENEKKQFYKAQKKFISGKESIASGKKLKGVKLLAEAMAGHKEVRYFMKNTFLFQLKNRILH